MEAPKMATVNCRFAVEPAHAFGVLADGWSYPLWVVGATHMRRVDPNWPSVGAQLHHSVGVWPLTLEDRTEVLAVEHGRRLELRAHAWPGGTARVEIVLQPEGAGTVVTMTERAEKGPGRLVPGRCQDVLLRPRLVESLQRLRAVAENRTHIAYGGPSG
jgi:PAS domain-containing protein